MTVRRAAWIAALIAVLVYLPALGNRFALDDGPIVERNDAAHSIGAALGAFTHPYWPPEHGAGLWRPMVILSFAADWQLSGGNTTWLHATNVLLHATATALVVVLLAPYATAAGALAGGVLFAVHPVHVEAVANLVGRAELLVACFLLAALLAARRMRRLRAEGRNAAVAELLLVVFVIAALLSKEHAVVAVALLWLDDRARDEPGPRLPLRVYVTVSLITVVWLVVRRGVEHGLGFAAVAPTFFHLGAVGRISTMLPAVLVVLRLLVWPFDLSPDYHPMVIERLEHPTAVGALGLLVLLATVLLALRSWKEHRVASLGLLIIGVAWLPTSNLLFPSGIVLAERTLYLASVGLTLLAASLWDAVARRAVLARGATVVALAAAALLAIRSWTQASVWRSTRDLVVSALLNHPESYKVHQSAARVLWRLGLRNEGLAEYGVAAEIYPLDHYLLAEVGSAALETGRVRLALRVLRQAEQLDTAYSLTQELMAQGLLRIDSAQAALAHARRAVAADPTRAEPARMLAASLMALGQADSAVAVWPAFEARGGRTFDRWLLGAVTLAAAGRGAPAREALDSASRLVTMDSIDQRRLAEARVEVNRAAGGVVRP